MAAPDLDAIATAAAATLTAKGITVDGRALKVYPYEPRVFDTLPAAAILGPTEILRDEEIQLGAYLWKLTYRVTVAVRLSDPERGQEDARSVWSSVVDAFDDDATLGGTVDEAILVSGEMAFSEKDEPQQAVYLTSELAVTALSN